MQTLALEPQTLNNFIDNSHISAEPKETIPVLNPSNSQVIGHVPLSNSIQAAVSSSKLALLKWSKLTVKSRVQYLFKFRDLVTKYLDELANLIVTEHGKTKSEAIAEIHKGIETLDYAISLPQLISGNIQQVSRGITCHDKLEPIGVCVSIVPFNFPFMVPFWTIPIALAAGNTLIIKPSEKVPFTMSRVMEIFAEAGLPEGSFI